MQRWPTTMPCLRQLAQWYHPNSKRSWRVMRACSMPQEGPICSPASPMAWVAAQQVYHATQRFPQLESTGIARHRCRWGSCFWPKRAMTTGALLLQRLSSVCFEVQGWVHGSRLIWLGEPTSGMYQRWAGRNARRHSASRAAAAAGNSSSQPASALSCRMPDVEALFCLSNALSTSHFL